MNFNLIRQLKIIKHGIVKTRSFDKQIKKFFGRRGLSLKQYLKKKKSDNIIISFTTFPKRLKYVYYTVFSLIKQSIRPEKIILWLSEQEFPEKSEAIPDSLIQFFDFNFEIRFVNENYRSFMKLVFSLPEFPNKSIITIDDDAFYNTKWLESFWSLHQKYPNDILASKIHRISFFNRTIAPYSEWDNNIIKKDSSRFNFQVGVGGVLYPPNSLYSDTHNPDLFLKLCPHYADDTWFYFMAFLKGTKIRKVRNRNFIKDFDYILDDEYNDVPVMSEINIYQKKNDLQIKWVMEYYNLDRNFYDLYLTENKIK
jgi:hypothetical protein